MIKFIQCVRKKPEVSIQDFRPSLEVLPGEGDRVGQGRERRWTHIFHHARVEENLQVMLVRGTSEPYDGVAQFRISNAPRMIEASRTSPPRVSGRSFRYCRSSSWTWRTPHSSSPPKTWRSADETRMQILLSLLVTVTPAAASGDRRSPISLKRSIPRWSRSPPSRRPSPTKDRPSVPGRVVSDRVS